MKYWSEIHKCKENIQNVMWKRKNKMYDAPASAGKESDKRLKTQGDRLLKRQKAIY